jgi:hypothetical protein
MATCGAALLLEACGTGIAPSPLSQVTPTAGINNSSAFKLPTYDPIVPRVKPELPGDAVIPDGYLRFRSLRTNPFRKHQGQAVNSRG